MKNKHFHLLSIVSICLVFLSVSALGQSVYVTRLWHNHQPIYWPEWNNDGSQDSRVQYAWDSIQKNGQTYSGSTEKHPCNLLVSGYPCGSGDSIFDKNDRVQAYQTAAKDSLASINNNIGFAMSYSGSLIDNVRSLGSRNSHGYGNGWNNAFTEARKDWKTPSGSSRLDMLGFTYHHSLAAVLPKEVLRKEIQLFKQAWWKAWGGNSDLSDHSKGFFPTEMAFSPEMVDVLVDEGYEWVVVASHHISRTCSTYLDQTGHGASYSKICISPPNKADQTGPSPSSGWWYGSPNECNSAYNVAPYAYQLHWTKYVDPETGTEKKIIAFPSDDVESYVAGYSGAQVSLIDANIAPHSNENKPSVVMPSTDGDNAWGGGSSSYHESTPSFFNEVGSKGYGYTSPQDFVNKFRPANDDIIDIEPGAWQFPEGGYGSPYFLKWIEPPLDVSNYADNYPNTKVDFENADAVNMKFWIWGPIMAGANWCETAEQIYEDAGGTVQSWKIAYPYDWDGSWTSPNDVELAWHIFLAGFDSGFGYYGGVGNDDEVKTALATRRAQEKLNDYIRNNISSDRTPPTVFRPQRFPWNPGGYTFGWFNPTDSDNSFLKKMPSDFYVWSLVYDVSDISSINVKLRFDNDGVNPVDNNDNDTYSGGPGVGAWSTIPMKTKPLLNDSTRMNDLANNGQINYFIMPLENADLAYVKIDCVRGALVDYYIEATDSKGNVHKSDIFHVYVEDDGTTPSSECGGEVASLNVRASSYPGPTHNSCPDGDCNPNWNTNETLYLNANTWPTQAGVSVKAHYKVDAGSFKTENMVWEENSGNLSRWAFEVGKYPEGTCVEYWIEASNSETNVTDNNNGDNYTICVTNKADPLPSVTWAPENPDGCVDVTITYNPDNGPIDGASSVNIHIGYNNWTNSTTPPGNAMTDNNDGTFSYVYSCPPGTEQIDFAFNDGTTWDNNDGKDWHITVANCLAGPLVEITAPSNGTITSNLVHDISGTCNSEAYGNVAWENTTTSDSGTIAVSSSWTIENVPLATGTNIIRVVASNEPIGTVLASDTSTDNAYSGGSWNGLDNGGTGFKGWILNDPGSNGGHFSDNTGWGLWANNGSFAEGMRPFSNDLAVGQTVRIFFKNGDMDGNPSNVGISLRNDPDDSLLEFYISGGTNGSNYILKDKDGENDTGIAHTTDGFNIAITLTSANKYSAEIAGQTFTGELIDSTNQVLSEFRVWNHNSGSGSANNLYVNTLRISSGGGTSSQVVTDTVTIVRSTSDLDSDNDGFTDVQEELMGTNPNDPKELLEIKSIDYKTISNGFPIVWSTVGGKEYQIRYTHDLSNKVYDVLTNVVEDDVANGVYTSEEYLDTSGSGQKQRFYKILFVLP